MWVCPNYVTCGCGHVNFELLALPKPDLLQRLASFPSKAMQSQYQCTGIFGYCRLFETKIITPPLNMQSSLVLSSIYLATVGRLVVKMTVHLGSLYEVVSRESMGA